MTILPKKKPGKDKVDNDNAEHSPHSPPNGDVNNRNVGRSRAGARQHEPPTDEYDIHPTTSHNKRRHRSSPHRTFRKLRGDGHNLAHRDRPSKHRDRTSTTTSHNHGVENINILPISPQLDNINILSHLPGGAGSSPSHRDLKRDSLELPAIEETGNNSEDEYSPMLPTEFNFPGCEKARNFDELDVLFEKVLKDKRGLIIKHMAPDGACLFRAVADQVYGDPEMHPCVRKCVVEYMAKNADFFKHYVTEDFNTYLQRKLQDVSHGNHIEIQAMCEMYSRPIEVFQYTLDPINTFQGTYATDNEPIRLSYHRNTHYNSVYDPYKATIGVGLGLPGHKPGAADKNLMQQAKKLSEDSHIEKTMMEDKLKETDWEVTQETIEEQVARESYLQWLRDNEKRATTSGCGSARATCSSTASAADGVAPHSSSTQWSSGASLAASSAGTPSCTATLRSATATRAPSRTPSTSSRSSSQSNSPTHPGTSTSPAITDNASGPLPLQSELNLLSMSPQHMELPHDLALSLGSAPHSPHIELGAVGGTSIIADDNETASIMNELPPHCFGLSDWNESDILAQVIAQSQQEYWDQLTNIKVSDEQMDSTVQPSTSKQNME